jgi:hypothetical protein
MLRKGGKVGMTEGDDDVQETTADFAKRYGFAQ